MQQAPHLDLQPSALLDEIPAMPHESLQRLINVIDGQDRQSVSIDCCMKDGFEIVVVSFDVGMQRLAVMLRREGMDGCLLYTSPSPRD